MQADDRATITFTALKSVTKYTVDKKEPLRRYNKILVHVLNNFLRKEFLESPLVHGASALTARMLISVTLVWRHCCDRFISDFK